MVHNTEQNSSDNLSSQPPPPTNSIALTRSSGTCSLYVYIRTVKQLDEFSGDGDSVLGDDGVRAETGASRDAEVQSRLNQTLVVAILHSTHNHIIITYKYMSDAQ